MNPSTVSWLASFSNKRFELILLITEQCNFRCVYCYEDFKIGKMEDDVMEGVKNLIDKRIEGLNLLQLSFFGGEPLLNKSAMLELSDYAKQKCEVNKINYIGGITTNGYSLDKNIFDDLINCGIMSYQVTLDGVKETHDKLRPTINGKSTFDKIYFNLKDMAGSKHNFECTLRFNIADSNFYSVKKFVEEFSLPFENDKRFTFHFHPIFGMSELKLTKTEQLKELKELAISKGFTYDDPSGHALCYAAQADSYVIRANGTVQKCTVARNSDLNNVGKLHKDGTMDLDQGKLKKWLFAEDKACSLQSLAMEKLVVPYEGAGKHLNKPVITERI